MRYIKFFSELGMEDVAIVGGKNASLGEMVRSLSSKGVKVPNGFATTSDAFHLYLQHNQLEKRIADTLANLDVSDVNALARAGAQLRHWIRSGNMPAELAEEIRTAYRTLETQYGPNPDVAVRSSATAEDLPGASFAGQQETYLNIRGSLNLIETTQQVFASLFTDRAISYRVDKGFDHVKIALSVGVQKMVRSDIGSSGVIFTLDTETGFRDVVLITAAYGLGENVVQGTVNPDEYYVYKPTLARGFRPIVKRQLGEKAIKMIYTQDAAAGQSTRNVNVRQEDRRKFALNDDEILQLARYAIIIEQHYTERAGEARPMDIEWAKDGETGELFVVQARPETVQAQLDLRVRETYRMPKPGKVVVTGKSVGQKIASGPARVIFEAADMNSLKPGEVLVTDITDPDWEPVMKIASAIVTNRGGRTCHAAIVAREIGIPAIVGCGDATDRIRTGQVVTVSCAEGNSGFVYDGAQPFSIDRVDLRTLPKPRTHLMINLGNPEHAFALATLPVEGVGLARLEFIISHSIRVHPRALIDYAKLDLATQKLIDDVTAGYPDRTSFYVDKLAEGVGNIAAAFYPKPVIVRMSDFKSNEYASLIGGTQFEPTEENPMIGFRGASRYPSEEFAPCFALECAAMKKVREVMGLDNVALMIPFTRTIAEAKQVLALMAQHGLTRGENGLKIHLMCEIPANALLADQFLEYFDGFSIGSNDLTQLTLGVDRDSGLVKGFDERNEAVLKLMEMAISACRRHNKYIGICGQAPSDYPEITRWLVKQGIESISLNPDCVLAMTQVVLEAERA